MDRLPRTDADLHGGALSVALIAACCLITALPARAQDDPAYPAATCAALWTAHARTLGPGADPLSFRDAAVARSGDPSAVDAFIATQTMRLIDLIHAYVDLSDRHSGELFESLLTTCERFAAENLRIGARGPEG